MGVKITNNASGTLAAAITSSATTLTLTSGQGALFPTLGVGDYCWCTLVDTSNNVEIIKVTARSTDTLTMTRGQDNTTAQAFAINDRLELRPTAALFAEFASTNVVDDTTPQLGGDLDLNGNDITGTGAIPSANLSGALPAIDGSALTGTVPSGIISMWSGLVGAIPSGWSLCDGTGGTPNLVGKFIKGASSAGGTGGSATTDGHTLTEAEMPSHTHGKSPYAPGSAAAYVAAGYNSYFNSTSNTTLATGGGGSHSHTFEPPYFELCYIIKD